MREYSLEHKVTADEIDAFGHVNNVVYLKWFNLIASKHCDQIGYGSAQMWQNGFGWIIRSHKIDYLFPIKPYEEVKIKTKVESIRGAASLRSYEVVNFHGRLCAKGETLWVWVDYKTGLPCRIPAQFASAFGF